jgi:uncharacterized protein (TIGR00299 family) protein
MKTLYLDIFSGLSGDMLIGALIDLGVDPVQLEKSLEKLWLDDEYHVHVTRGQKSQISGIKFDVHVYDHGNDPGHGHEHDAHGHHHHEHGHSHSHTHEDEEKQQHLKKLGLVPAQKSQSPAHVHGRNFADIKALILKSELSDWVKQKAIAVFHRIAVAEGRIHGLPPEQVHFHEVGAVDSIVDIVGGCIALELLGKPRVLASAVIEGTGFIKCAHGRMPLPAPATLEILGARGVGVTQCEEPNELVTPTGAAMLAEFVEHFGPMQNLVAAKTGFGLGTRDNRARPNVLRAVLADYGSEPTTGNDWETDRIALLETNLDDLNPEILGHFVEQALAAGALDVFYTPVQMKKSRPGTLLTVLCAEADADKFCEMILRETSAFGVRRTIAERRKLRREFTTVTTPHGEVKVKLGKLKGKILHATPEYESAKALAAKAGVPLKEIYEAVQRSEIKP